MRGFSHDKKCEILAPKMKSKTFVLTIMILVLISNVSFARSIVRVSDYGCDGFYYRYNELAQSMGKSNMILKKMPQKTLSNDNYDTYICTNGLSGHETTISLFANKEGYVSKVMIAGDAGDSAAMNNLGENFVLVLATLGVNKGEMNNFLNSWKNSDSADIRHWCNAGGRFILVSRNMNYDYNTFSATFTAAA